MIKSLCIVFLFVMLCSCNQNINDSYENGNDSALQKYYQAQQDIRELELVAQNRMSDSITNKILRSYKGLKKIESYRRACNNYQNSYALNKEQVSEEDIGAIIRFIGMRDKKAIPIEDCLRGQTILTVYLYKRKKDYISGTDNYVGKCVFSGSDEPYLTLKNLN